MKSLSVAVAIAISIPSVVMPTPAKAWGKYGHVAICDMAYRNFTDATRTELKRIFRIGQQGASGNARLYTRFNMSCLEEDEVPRKHPKDHFINFSRDTGDVVGATCPVDANSCILEAIDRDLAIVRDSNAKPQKRASALMAIGHWIGDIHQPLHISFADDRGGNYIRATGMCGNSQKNNLHSVWDNCLVDRALFAAIKAAPCYREKNWRPMTITYRGVDLLMGEQPYGRDARCQLTLLGKANDTDIRAWQSTAPWQWAKESYIITLDRPDRENAPSTRLQYCNWRSTEGACWFDDTHLAFAGAPQKVVNITDAYIRDYGPIAVKRVEMAGYRLAHMVNTALDPNYRGL